MELKFNQQVKCDPIIVRCTVYIDRVTAFHTFSCELPQNSIVLFAEQIGKKNFMPRIVYMENVE